jgi:hypothetical protein
MVAVVVVVVVGGGVTKAGFGHSLPLSIHALVVKAGLEAHVNQPARAERVFASECLFTCFWGYEYEYLAARTVGTCESALAS